MIPVWPDVVLSPTDLTTLSAVTECAHALQSAMRRGARRIVIDCTNLSSVSPAALDMLAGAQRDLRSYCAALRLACVPGPVLAAIEAANLAHVFIIRASVDDALSDHAPRRAG